VAGTVIRDLLEVTGGGKATSFVDIRDHAMIRMLTEGGRREELAQQQITDLSGCPYLPQLDEDDLALALLAEGHLPLRACGRRASAAASIAA
jgi:hypothetical protein